MKGGQQTSLYFKKKASPPSLTSSNPNPTNPFQASRARLPSGVTVMPGRGATDTVLQNIRSASNFAGPKHRIHNYTPRPTTTAVRGSTGNHALSGKRRSIVEVDDSDDFADPFGTRPANKRHQLDASSGPGDTISFRTHIGQKSLSTEQEDVLDLVIRKGRNVFFTGSAGTGKSFILRHIITELKEIHGDTSVAVTSSTGIAACNIGGCTLHSFAGIGLGLEEVPALCRRINKNGKARKRWMETRVLVIDEVSMLDSVLLDKLEQVARRLRDPSSPFGGIQLVLTGDFFQLPPVEKASDAGKIKFAFEAACWRKCGLRIIQLTHVYRQRDNTFVEMLNDIREGNLKPRTVNLFKNLHRPIANLNGVVPTHLYSLRRQVDDANDRQLRVLPGEPRVFTARDIGKESYTSKLDNNCLAPSRLILKLNAQVMLIKNIDQTLVNGSRGVVIGYEASDGKSGEMYPVVRFENNRNHVCKPEDWTMEVPGEGEVAKRIQVPLILAWAMSIHKSQGQTLERVVVDLQTIFEKGQAYVALSRATSIAGLQVLNFSPHSIMAHPKVIEFNKELQSMVRKC